MWVSLCLLWDSFLWKDDITRLLLAHISIFFLKHRYCTSKTSICNTAKPAHIHYADNFYPIYFQICYNFWKLDTNLCVEVPCRLFSPEKYFQKMSNTWQSDLFLYRQSEEDTDPLKRCSLWTTCVENSYIRTCKVDAIFYWYYNLSINPSHRRFVINRCILIYGSFCK